MSEGKAVWAKQNPSVKGCQASLGAGNKEPELRKSQEERNTGQQSLSPFQSLGPTGSVSGAENLLLLEEPGGFALCPRGNEGRLRSPPKLQTASDSRQDNCLREAPHQKPCKPSSPFLPCLGVCVCLPHSEPAAVVSNVLLSASWAGRF